MSDHGIEVGDYVTIIVPPGHAALDFSDDFTLGGTYKVIDTNVGEDVFELQDEDYFGEIGLYRDEFDRDHRSVFYVDHRAVKLVPKIRKIFIKEK